MSAQDIKNTTTCHLCAVISNAAKILELAHVCMNDSDKDGAIKFIDNAISELQRKPKVFCPSSKTEYYGDGGEVIGVKFIHRDRTETEHGDCTNKF